MNRILLLLLIGSSFLASCSKKTQPSVSKSSKPSEAPKKVVVSEPPVTSNTNPPETTSVAPPAVAIASPMIVIDESGKVITSRDKLPVDIAAKVNYSKISRAYTPVQRQNLIYRFKMVPPRVLFVPDQISSKSARGTYVVYKKKFWYWKKEDGLFHIDETYYQ